MEDEDAHAPEPSRVAGGAAARSAPHVRAPDVPAARAFDRPRDPAAAEPGQLYVDRETGEPLEVVGKVLPLPPSKSQLPWAIENLRFCNWCDQLAQKDLNDCPTCGRRMAALPR